MSHLWEVGKLDKTSRGENLILPQGCLRSPGTQGNTRILVYRDTSKLLIMNMQFILAALVYSSSADSNRVLSDIPFGPAKSHIRRLRIANRLWINVSIPNVNYATDDEIWGSEFPIDDDMSSNRKRKLINLATEQGSTVTTVKGFCKYSKPEETNTRSLCDTQRKPQQETHSLCETQRNLLEKYVTMSYNYMLPATH